MNKHTPKKYIEQERRVDPSTLEKITTVYRDCVYIPRNRKPGRPIPIFRKNGLPALEQWIDKTWHQRMLHPDDILTPHTPPMSGDYIQLLDAQGRPSENHAEVFMTAGELGQALYLVEDMDGETFAVTRLEELDNQARRAWQQVITATA